MINTISDYLKIGVPVWVVVLFSSITGFLFISLVDLSKTHSICITMIAYISLGAVFWQRQKTGKISESFKKATITVDSFCLGMSAGGIIFGHEIWFKIICAIFVVITTLSILSLFFIAEEAEG